MLEGNKEKKESRGARKKKKVLTGSKRERQGDQEEDEW